ETPAGTSSFFPSHDVATSGFVSNMASSRLEINFVRLLSRCESMALEKRTDAEWRLEKYVDALQDMLAALKKSSRYTKVLGKSTMKIIFFCDASFWKLPFSKPVPEVLTDYSRKVDFLKGLLDAEKLSSPTEKAVANQFLAPGRSPTLAGERMPASKAVHVQTKARLTGEMKRDLMAEDSAKKAISETDVRQRRKEYVENNRLPSSVVHRHPRGLLLDERQSAAELDAVLQHHHNLQEKLAEEMLSLARNLKNNTVAAQSIIRQDNQTLTQSMRQADVNFEKLKTESERLEQHAKKSVNWFLWLMLVLVCFSFISMILFIRLFPRLR
ncbi:vesicle transport protein USE1-like, partial [Scleropages formosus]